MRWAVRRRTRVIAAVLAGIAVPVLGTLSIAAPPAAGHASLISTTPGDGAALEEFPKTVQLLFTEEISAPAYVIVTAPDGTSLGAGAVAVDGPQVTMPTTTSTIQGQYSVAFRVVSADGHPITGQITASIGTAPPPGPTTGSSSAPTQQEVDAPGTAVAGPATSRSPGSTDPAMSRNAVVITVAVLLFGLAGALALLARRFPDAPAYETPAED